MALPEITHLQFLVLSTLRDDERPGRDVRRSLAERGVDRTDPAFYQMMARLEEAGLVAGRYERRVVEGQAIKERHYRITDDGRDAMEATLTFYRDGPGTARDDERRA